ncbi:PIH1 domain-containing protein 1 [Procambarus clarkii]|uniref:PIH1 domain-containing protein 1 n=1 Tax=Procambarus clarkii TaxID=6728 RepID=UPI001E67346E|nr:PIH1 domain-containing protein 1-like [Procambarus clarkii]
MEKKSSSVLEIDENIIRRKLVLEGNVPQELDSLFPKASPYERATTIKPKPGSCVKTFDDQKKKVFINICTSDAIPAPEDITDQELIAILESDAPSDFRVPMSIGELHYEKAKSGEDCMAFDVIINEQFFLKMFDDPLFHNFFMIATLEGIEEKYSLKLDKNGWTVLKNKKYHGSMSEQTVRTTIPLVQELSGARHWKPKDVPSTSSSTSPTANPPSKPLITELSTKTIASISETAEKSKPTFLMKKVQEENGHEDLIVEVNLPSMVSGKAISVDVGEDRLVVESSKNLLDVFVPFSLDNDNAEAHFITSTRVLIVRVPVLHA